MGLWSLDVFTLTFAHEDDDEERQKREAEALDPGRSQDAAEEPEADPSGPRLTGRGFCEDRQHLTPHRLHGEGVLAGGRHRLVFQTFDHRQLFI